MSRKRILLLVLTLALLALIVYTPHYSYKYPRHIDEWHHIEEAYRLREGEYSGGQIGFRFGFHLILAALSYILPLVKYYHIFPPIMGMISALTLFYVSFKKTNSYYVGLFSILFFALIGSNSNILGLWFFAPLSFSIPFIFLYFYYFTEGLANKNKNQILISLGIMLFLTVVYPIAVLFAIPILAIYAFIHREYLFKEWEFFGLFLLIPLVGYLLFSYFSDLNLIRSLIFEKGWGIYEINNSIFEVYSLVGLAFAIVGILALVLYDFKKFIPYIIWPIWLLFMILIYRITDMSFLTPYQRNIYFLAISLPFLSAVGLYSSIVFIQRRINQSRFKQKELLKNILIIGIMILALVMASRSYFTIPQDIDLYRSIGDEDYLAMTYLKDFPKGKVMSLPDRGNAIYPISRKDAMASGYFNSNYIRDVVDFYSSKTCEEKNKILKENEISYVYSDFIIDCNWEVIYSQNQRIIYRP